MVDVDEDVARHAEQARCGQDRILPKPEHRHVHCAGSRRILLRVPLAAHWQRERSQIPRLRLHLLTDAGGVGGSDRTLCPLLQVQRCRRGHLDWHDLGSQGIWERRCRPEALNSKPRKSRCTFNRKQNSKP